MGSKLSCKTPESHGGQGMIHMLQDAPAFSDLLSRHIPFEEEPLDRLFNSTEKRLARMLLVLANFEKEGQAQPVIPKISQETLAEIIGTTPSRVNFFMNKFRKLGLIA
jgi:CRP/FNR family cyclic AMP-dependent transcriptional regulator